MGHKDSSTFGFVLLVIWGALLFSTFLFLGVLLYLKPDSVPIPDDVRSPGGVPASPVLLPIFGLTALSTSAIALTFPKALYRNQLRKLKLQTKPVADPDAMPGYGAHVKAPLHARAARDRVLLLYMTRIIVACALGESVAIQGFVLGFLGFPLSYVFGSFALGWLLILLNFPRASAALKEAERVIGVRFPENS